MTPCAARALYGPRALWERTGFALRAIFAPTTGVPMTLVSAHPVILQGRVWAFGPGAPAFRMLDELRHRRVDIACSLSWNYDTRLQTDRLVRLHRRLTRPGNQHLQIMATSAAEQRRLGRCGLHSIHVSVLALADESLYRPLPGYPRRFAAIYDGRLAPYKRHSLAALIPSLALITAPHNEVAHPGYTETIQDVLDRAHLFNGPPCSPDYRHLSGTEVNECLNQSAVGLCLSAEEGAMRACIQYLLAGIPVVSTPSAGGRHEFFDPDFVKVVDPTPEAVAGGVSEMQKRDLDPQEIRSRTLEKMQPHRDRFAGYLEAVCQAQGVPRRYRAPWPELFGNTLHMQGQLDIDETLRQIRAAAPR